MGGDNIIYSNNIMTNTYNLSLKIHINDDNIITFIYWLINILRLWLFLRISFWNRTG